MLLDQHLYWSLNNILISHSDFIVGGFNNNLINLSFLLCIALGFRLQLGLCL